MIITAIIGHEYKRTWLGDEISGRGRGEREFCG
jgi:hypothetical protein